MEILPKASFTDIKKERFPALWRIERGWSPPRTAELFFSMKSATLI
jgi:hypothetical protein